jgi:cyclic pyranopterin phosphate synthase
LDEVVTKQEILEQLNEVFSLKPIKPNYQGEVAKRYQYQDGDGEIGVISSVTEPFCATCTRARLSAEGKLYTCLFASSGTDLRSLLRNGADDETIQHCVINVWENRKDRYSEERNQYTKNKPKVEMSHIGG